VGNRATRTTLQGIASYTHDGLNRLAQASQPDPIDPLRQVTEAFTYDPVGNRTASHLATGQVHDAANRLLEDSQFTYTYDATGNLTTKTSRATGARTVYTYTVENQLTQVDQFTLAGGATPTLTARYRYDPLGRRIAKEVTQGATTASTRYLYDNEDILVELDGINTVMARYTHGPGIDEPLIMVRQGQAFFYHPDGLGSIWDLTDATGTVAKSYTYDSFGNLLAQPGTVANPYTYTGREVDPETGFYHYRFRYLDPALGRFIGEDPIGLWGGINLYTYVANKPLRYIDPYGLVIVGLTGRGTPPDDPTSGIVQIGKAVGADQIYSYRDINTAVTLIASAIENCPTQPVILFGHSRGGVGVLRIAEILGARGIPVDLAVTIDAVQSPTDNGGRVVPANVRLNVNPYQTNNVLGINGGPNRAADPEVSRVINRDFSAVQGIAHETIDNSAAVQALVIQAINRARSAR